ncbi:MAG TPA: hypothetical protein VGB19_16685 [Actinomycetota bacterium]
MALAFSAFVGLPLAAALFDAGAPSGTCPTLAGRGTFIAEHALFGLTIGLGTTALLRRRRQEQTTSSVRSAGKSRLGGIHVTGPRWGRLRSDEVDAEWRLALPGLDR